MEHTKSTDKFNFSLSISTQGHKFIAMAVQAQLCDTLNSVSFLLSPEQHKHWEQRSWQSEAGEDVHPVQESAGI